MAFSPSTSVEQFQSLVKTSNRILGLCGAGLSAPSGLPTFRGAGGLWRNHEPTSLATPDAFRKDPALVWLFYAWRRHMALKAQPNPGHVALARLAEKKENFLCLTQNVDGENPWPPSPSSVLCFPADTSQASPFVLAIQKKSFVCCMAISWTSSVLTRHAATSSWTIGMIPSVLPSPPLPLSIPQRIKAYRSWIQRCPPRRLTSKTFLIAPRARIAC